MAAFGGAAAPPEDGAAVAPEAGEEEDLEFDDWLVQELKDLSLDVEVYETYIKGIMDDEDTALEERAQSVLDLLSGATEEDLTSFGSSLQTMWELQALKPQLQSAPPPSADVSEYMKRLEADKQAAQEALDRQAEELMAKQADRSEIRGREALLSRYGAVGDGVDEDGNVIASASEGLHSADSGLSQMLGANMNKARVQEEAKAMREKAKADHAAKVARDKEQQLREKMRKEKEKKRTQKREKQRGCG